MPKKTKPAAVPAPKAEPKPAAPAKSAPDKIRAELEAYRTTTCKLDGRAVYQKSPEILFTEAAAHRLQFLAKDPDMAALIMAGGTLKGCVQSIVAYAKADIGNGGEMPEEEFRAAIRDYYRMPDKAATKDDPKLKAHGNHSAKTENSDNQSAKTVPSQRQPGTKPKAHAPTMLGTQINMFDAMGLPKATVIQGDPSPELVAAVQDLAERLAAPDDEDETMVTPEDGEKEGEE